MVIRSLINRQEKLVPGVVAANRRAYIPGMADFIEYLRRRREALLRQRDKIETELLRLKDAEGLYSESQELPAEREQEANLDKFLDPRWQRHPYRPRTIKEMILQALFDVHPNGLTASEILLDIQTRWKPTLERTSLSPQLTRLKNNNEIRNANTKWFAVPVETNAPQPEKADGASGSEGAA